MHSNSNNMKFKSYNDANEVVDEPFELLRSRYQENLETAMRTSDFIFDSIQLMYYKCHKVNFRRSGFADWIEKKKATKNPKNTDDKIHSNCCIKLWKIKWKPGRVSNIKPFINKYNWRETNYPSKIDDWKT